MIALKLTDFKYIPVAKINMSQSVNFGFATQQEYIVFNCYKIEKAA